MSTLLFFANSNVAIRKTCRTPAGRISLHLPWSRIPGFINNKKQPVLLLLTESMRRSLIPETLQSS